MRSTKWWTTWESDQRSLASKLSWVTKKLLFQQCY